MIILQVFVSHRHALSLSRNPSSCSRCRRLPGIAAMTSTWLYMRQSSRSVFTALNRIPIWATISRLWSVLHRLKDAANNLNLFCFFFFLFLLFFIEPLFVVLWFLWHFPPRDPNIPHGVYFWCLKLHWSELSSVFHVWRVVSMGKCWHGSTRVLSASRDDHPRTWISWSVDLLRLECRQN